MDDQWQVAESYGTIGIPRNEIIGKKLTDHMFFPESIQFYILNLARVKHFGVTQSMIASMYYKNEVFELYLRFQSYGPGQVLIRAKRLGIGQKIG